MRTGLNNKNNVVRPVIVRREPRGYARLDTNGRRMAGHSRRPVGLRVAAAPVVGWRPGGRRRSAAAPAPPAAAATLVHEKGMQMHRGRRTNQQRRRTAATGYRQVHVLRRKGETTLAFDRTKHHFRKHLHAHRGGVERSYSTYTSSRLNK